MDDKTKMEIVKRLSDIIGLLMSDNSTYTNQVIDDKSEPEINLTQNP